MSAVDRSRLPQPGPEPVFTFPTVVRRTTSTGLRVWTVEHRDVPVVLFLLLLHAGSASDPAGQPGLAALTADMLDEGSGDRSALDIEDALARLGAQFDTDVGVDATALSLLTLSRFGDAALQLLADIVARPRLAVEDFNRVRQLRLTRLTQLRDVAPAVAERTLAGLLYAGQPYGHLPLGTSETLRTVRRDDVVGFHERTWQPRRITLIAVGDGTHDDLFAVAERAFGWWNPPDGARPAVVGAAERAGGGPSPSPSGVPRVAIVDRPGAAQSELRIGQVAVPRRTPDYHALLVMNAILGGQFVSRLNMNLRESKGYTYGARSGFDFRLDAGPWVLQAAVQSRVTAEAIREALREVGEIRGSRPATADELSMAQSALTRGYPRGFETAWQVGWGLSQLALHSLPDDTFEQFVPSIRRVEIDAVTNGARRLAPERMSVVIVGDRATIEPGVRALGLGETAVVAPPE